MILGIFYLTGFIISFSYFGLRLNRSQIDVETGERVFAFVISSLFWFISVPYLIFVGDFFKSQRQLDEEIYSDYVEEEISNAISAMSEPPEDKEAFCDSLRQGIGTFQDMVDDIKL